MEYALEIEKVWLLGPRKLQEKEPPKTDLNTLSGRICQPACTTKRSSG